MINIITDSIDRQVFGILVDRLSKLMLQCVHVKVTKSKYEVYIFSTTFFRLILFFSEDYI